jgi:hypothetical protein
MLTAVMTSQRKLHSDIIRLHYLSAMQLILCVCVCVDHLLLKEVVTN